MERGRRVDEDIYQVSAALVYLTYMQDREGTMHIALTNYRYQRTWDITGIGALRLTVWTGMARQDCALDYLDLLLAPW